MTKAVAMILLLCFSFSLSGCSSWIADYRAYQLSNQTKSEKEAIAEIEPVILEALNTENRDLLASVFSERAKSLAPDLDAGIDYIFELYDGEFIEISDRNNSSLTHLEKNKNIEDISAWFMVKTTKGTYRLNYSFYNVNEVDPASLGVYTIWFTECSDTSDDKVQYSLPGINYPEREILHETITNLETCLADWNAEELRRLFSPRALRACDDFDSGVQHLFDTYLEFKILSTDYSWFTMECRDDTLSYHVYLNLDTTNGYFLLYFRYDESENEDDNGLYCVKLMRKEWDDMMFGRDDLGDGYDRSGIYYPAWDE